MARALRLGTLPPKFFFCSCPPHLGRIGRYSVYAEVFNGWPFTNRHTNAPGTSADSINEGDTRQSGRQCRLWWPRQCPQPRQVHQWQGGSGCVPYPGRPARAVSSDAPDAAVRPTGIQLAARRDACAVQRLRDEVICRSPRRRAARTAFVLGQRDGAVRAMSARRLHPAFADSTVNHDERTNHAHHHRIAATRR